MFVPALLLVVALFVVFGLIVMKVDHLALLAPRSTAALHAAAGSYCTDQCRTGDGRCPLTGTAEAAPICPLWRFIAADVPTQQFGSPFGERRPIAA